MHALKAVSSPITTSTNNHITLSTPQLHSCASSNYAVTGHARLLRLWRGTTTTKQDYRKQHWAEGLVNSRMVRVTSNEAERVNGVGVERPTDQ
jgi:hypothetical protein